MTQFFGEFDTLASIEEAFGLAKGTLDPWVVLVASYSIDGYEGTAFVLMESRANGAYVEVNGSHCSCHGLETCWDPEVTDAQVLEHRAQKGDMGGPEVAKAVLDAVRRSAHQRLAERTRTEGGRIHGVC